MDIVGGIVLGYVFALLTLGICLINRKPDLNELFPRVKFADTNTVEQQLAHIASEKDEALEAYAQDNIEHTDEEIMDRMYACKTYLDIRADQGVDIDYIRRMVIKKNKDRGYYVN